MKMGVPFAVAVLAVSIAPLGACANQRNSQPTTSPSSSAKPAGERITTQLKAADGRQVADATFDFSNGYATVTVEAGPNQVLTPGFHGLQVHSEGRCEANSAAPGGGSAGDFNSAGDVYQAPGRPPRRARQEPATCRFAPAPPGWPAGPAGRPAGRPRRCRAREPPWGGETREFS